MIRLDIFSDPVCPWCYIGKANLDRALEAHAEHPFEIEWHPFQLNPDMPAEGVEKRTYLAARFGSEAKVDAIHNRLRDLAKQAGVAMDPDKPQRLPNTMNAHRLIHWAELEGKQAAMVSALFRAYWRDGRDIGDTEELCDIAEEIGLNPALIARLLATNEDSADIAARDAHARQRGISAVPTYVIANQYVLSGAQPVDMWGNVIAELAAKATSTGH